LNPGGQRTRYRFAGVFWATEKWEQCTKVDPNRLGDCQGKTGAKGLASGIEEGGCPQGKAVTGA